MIDYLLATAPLLLVSTFFRRITGNADPVIRNLHVARMSKRRRRTMVNCPTCNSDGKGWGEIIRFIGRDGHYMVMTDRCPSCRGRGMIPMRPLREHEGEATELLLEEAADAFCLECNNRRTTIIPASKSPTKTMVMDSCHTCCIPSILM